MPDDISKLSPPAERAAPTQGMPPAPAALQRVEGSALEVARERCIRILTDRFADDTLTIDEFEARLDRMYKAQTPAELDALLREVEQRAHRAQDAAAASVPVPYDSAPRRILAIMSETKRTGRWAMPRELEVRAIMSNVVIDLRDVAMPAGYCEIDLFAVMAEVVILVPPHVVVEDLSLTVMAESKNGAMDDGTLAPDAPRLRVTGTVLMASAQMLVGEPRLPLKEAIKQARKAQKKGWRRG
jgi:hypothetical protein